MNQNREQVGMPSVLGNESLFFREMFQVLQGCIDVRGEKVPVDLNTRKQELSIASTLLETDIKTPQSFFQLSPEQELLTRYHSIICHRFVMDTISFT